MTTIQRTLLAALCASLPIFGVGAAAAPALPLGSATMRSTITPDGEAIAISHVRRHHRRVYTHRARVFGPRDNVGSVYHGPGTGPYGASTQTGRSFSKCMLDEGYGRVRPCDAGGGPN